MALLYFAAVLLGDADSTAPTCEVGEARHAPDHSASAWILSPHPDIDGLDVPADIIAAIPGQELLGRPLNARESPSAVTFVAVNWGPYACAASHYEPLEVSKTAYRNRTDDLFITSKGQALHPGPRGRRPRLAVGQTMRCRPIESGSRLANC
jgi:hypothetical protein